MCPHFSTSESSRPASANAPWPQDVQAINRDMAVEKVSAAPGTNRPGALLCRCPRVAEGTQGYPNLACCWSSFGEYICLERNRKRHSEITFTNRNVDGELSVHGARLLCLRGNPGAVGAVSRMGSLQTQAEKAIDAMGITQPAVTITTKSPVCPLPSVAVAWHCWVPNPRQPQGRGLSWLLPSLQRLLSRLPSS